MPLVSLPAQTGLTVLELRGVTKMKQKLQRGKQLSSHSPGFSPGDRKKAADDPSGRKRSRLGLTLSVCANLIILPGVC